MQIISDEKIAEFKNFLEQHDFFYVIGHKDPDGDAIYSCMALAELLKAKNCSYQLLSAGPFKRPEIRSMAIFFSFWQQYNYPPPAPKTNAFSPQQFY